MAAIKLPPRQRMINMMYLVLTAMLAMNVSKEVLDAFAVLDADLVRSEHAHEQRSSVEYAAFDEAARAFPDRFGELSRKAHEVEHMADSLVDHIEAMKTSAIADAESKTRDEVVSTGSDGKDSLMALAAVEAKDDRDAITRQLVGSEPAEPKDGPGSAVDLKRRIIAFRDHLKALCASREPALANGLDLLFALKGARDASGTMNNWESLNFYNVPLAAGVAHLSKLQADVRSAENDVVKWLYRSATAETYPMSSLTSAVIPQSNVVVVGDSFRADVFLAAYDEKNKARIELNDGTIVPLGADGKGKLRLPSGAVGERKLEGTIHYQGPKGMEDHPFAVTYQAMAPVLVASPTKMNVLYRGVENPVSFSVPGVTAEQVKPILTNGTVYRKSDGWYAKVNSIGTAQMSALVTMPDGGVRTIGPVEFRVKDLPPPAPWIEDITSKDTKAPLSTLKRSPGVAIKPAEACEFNVRYKATGYLVSASMRGAAVEHRVVGNEFDAETKRLIAALRPGDRIWFEEIKARLANDEGPEFRLPAIALTVR